MSWGDGGKIADMIDKGTEDRKGIGMLLAVGLGSITVLRLTGGDEKGHEHICLQGVVRHYGTVGKGCQEIGTKPLFEAGLIAVYQQALVQKGRTDEHEGRETSPVVITLDINGTIGQQTVQTGKVMTTLLTRAFATVATQKVGNVFLDILDEVASEQLLGIMVSEDDIALMEVVEIDALGHPQDIDSNSHGDMVGMETDAFNLALTTLPAVDEQGDTVANGHLTDGLDREPEEDLQLTVQQHALKLLQLAIGNDDWLVFLVTIVVEVQPRTGVPVGSEYLTEPLLRGS
jgi:hypothetical protein